MKFLKNELAVILGAIGLATTLQAGDFDLDSITTIEGRSFQEILILGSDEHGLMFRHRSGIAKLPFSELSMNLRMLYEPVAEVRPADEAETTTGHSAAANSEALDSEPDHAVATVRTTLTAPGGFIHGALIQMPRPQASVVWPSHWPRYHPAHALAVPAFRELAVRDFLYTTGLAPRPAWIRPYPLPRHGPYSFHTCW